MKYGRCKACDARIIWALTSRGKKIPIDAEPDVKGTIILFKGANGEQKAHFDKPIIVGVDEYHRPRFTSHFATCPKAADFRKVKT